MMTDPDDDRMSWEGQEDYATFFTDIAPGSSKNAMGAYYIDA